MNTPAIEKGYAKDRQAVNILNINGQMLPLTLLNILLTIGNKWGECNSSNNLRNYRKRINKMEKLGHIKTLATGEIVATPKGCKYYGLKYNKFQHSTSTLQLEHRNVIHELYYKERVKNPKARKFNEKQIRKQDYCIKKGCFPDFVVGQNCYEVELTAKEKPKLRLKITALDNHFSNSVIVWYVKAETAEGRRIKRNIIEAYEYLGIEEVRYEIRSI
jgi:hypothetical protein